MRRSDEDCVVKEFFEGGVLFLFMYIVSHETELVVLQFADLVLQIEITCREMHHPAVSVHELESLSVSSSR